MLLFYCSSILRGWASFNGDMPYYACIVFHLVPTFVNRMWPSRNGIDNKSSTSSSRLLDHWWYWISIRVRHPWPASLWGFDKLLQFSFIDYLLYDILQILTFICIVATTSWNLQYFLVRFCFSGDSLRGGFLYCVVLQVDRRTFTNDVFNGV